IRAPAKVNPRKCPGDSDPASQADAFVTFPKRPDAAFAPGCGCAPRAEPGLAQSHGSGCPPETAHAKAPLASPPNRPAPHALRPEPSYNSSRSLLGSILLTGSTAGVLPLKPVTIPDSARA